ncbi:MAG: biotin synthase BioB [Planctomycetota bacterium]
MNQYIQEIASVVLSGRKLDRSQIDLLADRSRVDFYDLLYWANGIRERYFGRQIKVCSIIAGRLGGCDQDCAFCAQSSHYKTHVTKSELLNDEQILKAAEEAKVNGVSSFGIVYSGRSITEKELTRLEGLIKQIKKRFALEMCASLGIISPDQAARLKQAGLCRYNHNLETSEHHFKNIVTTHKYADRVATIRAAIETGLGVCGGGIFGVGETEKDRIDMAFELRGLGVDTVPMNFLHPIEGTPLGKTAALKPREILRIIALYRFILPATHLKIAGGRVLNLRDLQSWIFYAGATSILSGNYLTTAGRAVSEDMQMLKDLGLEVDGKTCE